MHPVMFTIPGWAFKGIVPLLILWGMYSIVVAANRNGAPVPKTPPKKPLKAPKDAKADDTATASDVKADVKAGEKTDAATDEKPEAKKAEPKWELPADSPSNAVVSMLIGLGVFAFAAPLGLHGSRGEMASQILKGFIRGTVWQGQWESLPIYSYGVMLGLSLVVGWYLVLGLTERQGLPRDRMADCYVFTAFAAIIGSRVLYIVTNLDEFPTLASMLKLRSGGLVAYGGFLGGLLGSMIFLFRNNFSLWTWADAAVPALGTGLGITRTGCYMYGCDFGRALPASAPGFLQRLGSFPHWGDGHGSPAWQQHVEHGFHTTQAVCTSVHGDFSPSDGMCKIPYAAHFSAPVHPTQLYESLMGFSIFLALMWLWTRRRWEGQIFLSFGILYGVGRSLLEIIRDDLERGTVGSLSTSQFIGITTAAICIPLYIYRAKHAKRAEPVNLFARAPSPAPAAPAAG